MSALNGISTETGSWTKKGTCTVSGIVNGTYDRVKMGKVHRYPNPRAKRYSERYLYYIELDGEKPNFAQPYPSKMAAAGKLVWFWNLRNQGKPIPRKTA
jgi:hypothetical protein